MVFNQEIFFSHHLSSRKCINIAPRNYVFGSSGSERSGVIYQ